MIRRHRPDPSRWTATAFTIAAIIVTLAGSITCGSLAWNALEQYGTAMCLLGTAGGVVGGALPGWLLAALSYRWLP